MEECKTGDVAGNQAGTLWKKPNCIMGVFEFGYTKYGIISFYTEMDL